MKHVTYAPPSVKYGKVRKSKTIPDQSMSIQEIVKRFVRGIPVDVVQRDPVYIDQEEDDLERLSRMDFGEKAEYAAALAERNARVQAELAEAERNESEAKQKAAKEAAEKSEKEAEAAADRAAAKRAAGKSGIVGP